MTSRIDTTLASGETDPWTPAADFCVQGQAVAGSAAVIEYQARLDASASWVAVGSIRPATEGLMMCMKLFQVRLAWSGNKAGDVLKAWSAE